MNKKTFTLILLVILLAIFALINFRIEIENKDEAGDNQEMSEIKALKQPISSSSNTVSYNSISSKSDQVGVNLKAKLVDMVEFEKDGDAAFQLISLNSVCSLEPKQ